MRVEVVDGAIKQVTLVYRLDKLFLVGVISLDLSQIIYLQDILAIFFSLEFIYV